MSVESQQIERSALEGKDREELHTIAVAMGGKPGSRAKKADIVDLILELAGGTAGAGSTTSSDSLASPTDDAAGAEEGKPKRARRPRGNGSGVEAKSATAETPPVEADSEESQPDASAGSAEGGDDQPTAGRDSRPEGRNGGRQGQGSQGQGSQRQGSQGQGSQGQAQDDEAESGNRRRRRRGRDRQSGDSSGQGSEEAWQGEPIEVEGVLDLRDEGYGFLRISGYLPSRDDVYVSVKQARQFSLRKGDRLKGASRPAARNEKNPAMLRIDSVNGVDPEKARSRPRFEDLTPLFPDSRLVMATKGVQADMTARIIDLIAPIGKGQRGLIVSPPKAGKTTIMKQIARSIEINNPDVHLIVLLVDERPEEVTDMRRWIKGEVAASTFDRPAEEHTMVAELTIERAKRMVEDGRDVVVILDGITRLARAYNLAAPTTGRAMSGGIDTGALYPPKKFFGAARNVEEGGSLTILASALIETGSRMDEVIFEEFKGTGNMELRLDRRLAERRIYPAIDVDASSTRHEELLFDRKQLQLVWKLRRVLSGLADGNSGAGLEMLIERLATFKNNDEFLAEIGKAPGGN